MKIKYLVSFLLLLIIHAGVKAQWHGDPAVVNNPISTSPADEGVPRCISDGLGGAIYIWNGTGQFLAQRKTASGANVWSATNNPIQVLLGSGTIFDITGDGKGGAFFSLQKENNSTSADVYVQYVNKDGKLPFGINGIKVNPTGSHYTTDPKICAGSKGVIITWSDNMKTQGQNVDYFSYAQVFTQRYDSSGAPQWQSGGVRVSIADSIRNVPEIVSDGNNGAFIAFTDYRNASLNMYNVYDNLDVYAQHLDSNGNRLWGVDDVVISNELYSQSIFLNYYPTPVKSMISDSAGGFILIYTTIESDFLYAQRVDAAGSLLFGPGGVTVAKSGYHSYLKLATDGANGVVASWTAYNFGAGFMYGQRITGAGATPWGDDGVLVNPLANEDFSRVNAIMSPDNSGNYIFAWPVQDDIWTYTGLKAQKLNASGILQWPVDGIDIFTTPNASVYFPDITYINDQSIVVVWSDSRNNATSGNDIYGAKIGPNGDLVESPTSEYFTVSDGNWSDPATWIANGIPSTGTDVIIRHNVVADLNTNCNSLTVETPGSLNVNPGINIIVLH